MTKILNQAEFTDFKIVVYSPSVQPVQRRLGHEIHYLNSNLLDRWDAFKIFPDSWICFLDADCQIDDSLILEVRHQIQNQCKSVVLCGRYKTDSSESNLSRAYNILCNTWLEAGLLAQEPRLLGGFFILFSSSKLRSIEFEKIAKWGAEDYRMARQLGKNEFNFKLSEPLFTSHKPKNEMFWFIRRAWLHGGNRPDDVRTNTKYWIKMLLGQNPFLSAYILLHFGTVFAGRIYIKMTNRSFQLKSLSGFLTKERSGNQSI